MNLEGKKILVVGLGKTGEAVCQFLLQKKARVKVSERRRAEELQKKIISLKEKGVFIEAGGHRKKSFLEADLIIPSPGVPLIEEIKLAKKKGIEVISEIELAFNFLKGKIVGITGSNGKSTTATLIHKILIDSGFKAFLGGNIGKPLISFVKKSKEEHIYVSEISSFQLQYVKNFRPKIAVFLNISPDHLDWHLSFKHYFEAKKKLFSRLKEEDVAILNADDSRVWALNERLRCHRYGFSRIRELSPGCFLQNDWIILSNTRRQKLIRTSRIPLLGTHNQENVMAASLVAHVLGVPPEKIRKSIQKFKTLEHRLEKVSTLNGVEFYNDSKATNVDSTLKSIQSFSRPIVLILGGRDKGADFSKLKDELKKKVKKAILIGEAKEKIRRALANVVPLEEAPTLKSAVRQSFSSAKPGEVVLLAPACASFDMFKNFEERGRIFKKEVRALEKEIKGENI